MEIKKTSEANLENERTTFFLLGFVVVLSTLFVFFEWQSKESLSPDWEGFSTLFIEEELIGLPEAIPVESENRESEPVVPEIKEAIQTDPAVVYEDFKVVEKLSEAEELEIEKQEATNERLKEQFIRTEKPVLHSPHSETPQDITYTQADIMPQFKGGYTELVRYLYNHIEYPSVALKQHIQGRVWCSFIINKNGLVSDVQLEQGVYAFLDDEAIRVLKTMPAWEPGLIAGEPVRVKIYLPIVFRRSN
jgi:protein TonB